MSFSTNTLSALTQLRPPFARSALLLFPFTPEGRANSGITVETLLGEPAVCPGSGVVKQISTSLPQWQTNNAELRAAVVSHIEIDHGSGVTTVVGGLSSVSVKSGQNVYRGDKLGDLFTNQLFIAAYVGRKAVNPLAINSHWIPQNSGVVTGQGGKLRYAPDRLLRDLSHGWVVLLRGGIRYFTHWLHPPYLLVNVAFNGDGSKAGLGATGQTSADHWNVYTPSDFLAIASAACYYYYYSYYGIEASYEYTNASVLYLNDYTNHLSSVFLERVAPLFSAASSASSWDNMLKRWVGGYIGPLPYENTFRLRNLAAGTYRLYLYANQGSYPTATTFYVSVNYGSPTAQSNSPIVTPVFVEGSNYVKYTLTVPAKGFITFKAVGYLSGLQLERV